MSRAIYSDFRRCIYCRACEIACEREHAGHCYIRVIRPDEAYSVPLNCRHCEIAPCVAVCPTQAISRTSEGMVSIEARKCIGCQYCVVACPFGALQFDAVNRIVGKCDLCQHRLSEGEVPACVATCPAQALIYGNLDTIMSKKRQEVAATFVWRWVRE
jgi:formate dehydrogenase iron-sulfur subunit